MPASIPPRPAACPQAKGDFSARISNDTTKVIKDWTTRWVLLPALAACACWLQLEWQPTHTTRRSSRTGPRGGGCGTGPLPLPSAAALQTCHHRRSFQDAPVHQKAVDKAYDELEAARKKVRLALWVPSGCRGGSGGSACAGRRVRRPAACSAHPPSFTARPTPHAPPPPPHGAPTCTRPPPAQVTAKKDSIEKIRLRIASDPKAQDKVTAEEGVLQGLAGKLSGALQWRRSRGAREGGARGWRGLQAGERRGRAGLLPSAPPALPPARPAPCGDPPLPPPTRHPPQWRRPTTPTWRRPSTRA